MELQTHWFFGTMSPDVIASAGQTGGAFLLGLAMALIMGLAGGSRK